LNINCSKDQLLDLDGMMSEKSDKPEDPFSWDMWFVPTWIFNDSWNWTNNLS
jgi:hypothetical protein